MLTEKQIKNLKKGDKLIAEVSFIRVSHDNDLICLVPVNSTGGNIIDAAGFYHQSCLSLPPAKPKYDPCRRFKTGDIVKPCSVHGRWCSHTWEDRSGIQYEVAKDEDPLTAHMELKDPDRPQPFLVHAAFFKLVTPVEETEPYFVQETPHTFDICKRGGSKFTAFYKDQPLAREHAEKYCAALNAEDRKEAQQ